MIKITDRDKKEILRISSTSPRTLGLKFSDWSLRSIAGYVREKKIVKKKMHTQAILQQEKCSERTWYRVETFKDSTWQKQGS
jgi:hypothetical protein